MLVGCVVIGGDGDIIFAVVLLILNAVERVGRAVENILSATSPTVFVFNSRERIRQYPDYSMPCLLK